MITELRRGTGAEKSEGLPGRGQTALSMTGDGLGSGKRILLTGGRAPATLDLARLLRTAGHTVFAAESAPYHLCRASRAVARSFAVPAPASDPSGFASALARIADECRVDAIVPTCEEIFYVSRELDRFAGRCEVFAAPLDELDRLHHKGAFIRLAEEAGLPVPPTATFEAPDGWLPLLTDGAFADGLVLKPAYSRFASRVIAVEPREERLSPSVREAIIRKLAEAVGGVSPRRPWIAQKLLRGEEWCTYGVAHDGVLTAFAAYRSRFRAGRGASIHFVAEAHPALADWVARFVRHARFTGQIAFDFMEEPGGAVYPLECNPRATSGIHLFSPADGLAEAILAPGRLVASGSVATPAPGAGAMLSPAMLTYGLAQAVRERRMREWLRAFAGSRDAVYRRGDAGPAAEQLKLFAWLRRTAARQGLTLQEASTIDIEWNGER
ncbi:ATP-grasp domain-containing protein [Cohnella sp. GCM10012308]|uniref:ATP-grasp domain-containing protein n=1 Tax=Cohnella sp. GCM10012308 TaxID=3317329 RepID=UPI00361082EB